MRSTRRRRGGAEEEHANTERWTTSYMDMVTVMMCLFIVLFAISQVDQQKFFALRESLAASFGQPSSTNLQVLDGGKGVLAADSVVPDPPDVTNESGGPVQGAEHAGNLIQAEAEVAELLELRNRLAQALESRDAASDVTFAITDRGLVIGLVSEDVFFGAESAVLTEDSRTVIDALSPILAEDTHPLSIEGHANILPVTGRYETNWELSADRATQVLRRMVEQGGVAAGRTRAIGFGDAHPLPESHLDPLTVNRRVDVVVLSDAPEAVRALMPQVVAEAEGV
ncbi:OmpA/MotB family protein [Georgenia subflava]|uniref:OmpA family protein n=1 Tax=Georgenia subflava TaxID=1622177 RepID=A0A6N7ENG7_9MICO|nr:flagellar motor protein MotB [Georgenia subflava]MPV39001.1 OmpA family protein [Georgenia subflava]